MLKPKDGKNSQKEKGAVRAPNSECLQEGKQKHFNTTAPAKTSTLSGSGKPPPRRQTQNEVALIAFLAVGDRGFTTFEANSEWQCTALHSLVSQLQIKHNIMFDREYDPYTNQQGRVTNVMRYWIAQDSITSAKRLVNRYRLNRALLPLYLTEEAANNEQA